MTGKTLFMYTATLAIALATLFSNAWAQETPRGVGEVFFSGYGEMHYNAPSDETNELDFHRLVIGVGATFGKNIGFHAELDFEHAFTEPEVEFAYLDFFYREGLSFRAGMMLVPVGPLNEFHEPPLFYSVERPYVQKFVIPTSWQEPGVGVTGTLADGSIGYRAYLVGGLDASGFRASDGIRKGRQRGAEARADDLAVVGRAEYSPALNVTIGASGYFGGAAQGDKSLDDATVSIAEVDARVKIFDFDVQALYAAVFIGAADSVSANSAAETVVGERMVGIQGEVAYHLLRRLTQTEADLVAFARYETFDTQDKVPGGFERDRALDRQVVTIGLSFLPVSDVAIKADIELWNSGDGEEWNQVNVGIGFMY